LELEAEHWTGELLRDYAEGNPGLIRGDDTPKTNPYNSIHYLRYLGYRDYLENLIQGVSDFVICNTLRQPTLTR